MITLSASLARPGWLVGLRADYRHGFPRRVLFEIRHVPPEFSAARACVLCELSQRPGGSSKFLSLLVRATVGGGLVCSSIDDLSFSRMINRHVSRESVAVDRHAH